MRSWKYIGLVLAVAVVSPAVAVAIGGGTTSGDIRTTPSGFDATARLLAGGRGVRVSGPVTCTKGRRVRIDVTLTQRASGAVARGTWTARCTGVSRRWTIKRASALTGRFVTGQATACAAAATATSKRATDAVQWCRLIRLAA